MAPNDVDHYRRIYCSASSGNFDIYVIFIEKGLSLLNNRGLLGFIVPHKFFQASLVHQFEKLFHKATTLEKSFIWSRTSFLQCNHLHLPALLEHSAQ